MPGQLGVTTFSARVGGAACQCLGVAASTGLLSLLRSTLRNGGCEVGAAGWDVCVCRGWGVVAKRLVGGREGREWNSVICFREMS